MSQVVHSAQQQAEPSPVNRQKILTKKLTLFNRLVRLSWFQFLVGNLSWSQMGQPRKQDDFKRYVNLKQPWHELLVDVILFAILVVVAPIYGLIRFFNHKVFRSYWSKFIFGATCGAICMCGLFVVANEFFKRMDLRIDWL